MYTVHHLNNAFTALIYQPLTYPLFRPRLQSLKVQDSTVAIAASDAGKPIGLAVAEIQPDRQSAEVLSIFVVPTYRRQGVGTNLLTRLEQELVLQGCKNAEFFYTTGQPTTLAVENLLQKCHWTPPQPERLVCKSSYEKMVEASWMKLKLPTSYTIFPWQEITPQERIAIQQQQEESPWIPPDLIPFDHEENFEPLISLGLRYKGQVVGWMLTHRLAPDTIRYTCSFVRYDLQKMGRIIPLYVEAIKTQAAAKIPYAVWAVPFDHNYMAHFVRKRMAPYLVSLEEHKRCFKSF